MSKAKRIRKRKMLVNHIKRARKSDYGNPRYSYSKTQRIARKLGINY